MNVRLLLIVSLFMIVQCIHAQEKTQWRWFSATSMTDDWLQEKGVAYIDLNSTTFNAELYLGNEVRHYIKGTRKGNKIVAKLSTAETDQENYPLSGEYQIRKWNSEDSSGREIIVLYWGGIVFGFTRDLK